ncbi:MAG: hypothetical protein HY305_04435 [Sphingobacteriales bacterium]|nr:hypothetical protein [Sphingobacteriales bacterium]
MKKAILFSALGLGILILSVSSCKKDKTECDVTLQTLAGKYSIVKVEAGATALGQTVYVNATDTIPSCHRDDTFTLGADSTLIYTDAGTRCEGNSATESTTWSLTTDGKVRFHTLESIDLDITSATVVSFDCSTLVIVQPMEENTKLRFTFKK